MENPLFVDSEYIPFVTYYDDDDYDDYNTPYTGRVDEITFATPSSTEKPSTSPLRQKVEQDKVIALHRLLNLTGDPDLVGTYRFKLKAYFWWGKCDENVLKVDETSTAIEQSFKAATKLKQELPTDIEIESFIFMKTFEIMKFLSLAEDIHVKTCRIHTNYMLP